MSDEKRPEGEPESESNTEEEPLKGLNLTLVYSLIAVGILAAMCIAFFIVLPFYHHRH